MDSNPMCHSLESAVFLRYLLILPCQLLFLLRYSLLCPATYTGKAKGQTAICLRPDDLGLFEGQKGGVSLTSQKTILVYVSSWVRMQGKRRSDCLGLINSHVLLKLPTSIGAAKISHLRTPTWL